MKHSPSAHPHSSDKLLFLTDEKLRSAIELLFFAYRDFTGDPDRILEARGYGRAHHRAIHFIKHRPGITVAGLIEMLGVTKQSLNRVLRQLINDGLVVQQVGETDRRQRLLTLSEEGAALEAQLPSLERRLGEEMAEERQRGDAHIARSEAHVAAARADYGVVVDGAGLVDIAATEALRAAGGD